MKIKVFKTQIKIELKRVFDQMERNEWKWRWLGWYMGTWWNCCKGCSEWIRTIFSIPKLFELLRTTKLAICSETKNRWNLFWRWFLIWMTLKINGWNEFRLVVWATTLDLFQKIFLFGKNQGTQTTQNFRFRLRSARHFPFEVRTPYLGLL